MLVREKFRLGKKSRNNGRCTNDHIIDTEKDNYKDFAGNITVLKSMEEVLGTEKKKKTR